MIACWAAFPLLLTILAYGCGALVERAAGRTLALGVRLPCGAALMIAALDLATRAAVTAPLAVPAVIALALVGFALRRRRVAGGRESAAAIAAVAVLAVYAAPVVLSGMATWAGYVKLDDTATWLALVDRALSAGRTVSGLAPSTYRQTLIAYLAGGYPLGSFLPLGLGHRLTGQDAAWLVDPWMAFMAAMLALALQRIAASMLRSCGGPRGEADAGSRRAAAVAFVAAQPALLYGYYLWGGIKEMAAAMLIAALAAALPLCAEGERRARALIPAAVVVWAMFACLSSGGLVWMAPGAALALALLHLRGGLRLPSRRATLAAAGGCALAALLALRPGGFVARNLGTLTGGRELGNLLAPLKLRQIAGIWPASDFRLAPSSPALTDALIALALLLAGAGALAALRLRARGLLLHVCCALAGALIVYAIGSPWLAGKALASASTAIPLAALCACALIWERSAAVRGRVVRLRRVAAAVAALAIAGGVAWSNVLAYGGASLAPRAQYTELEAIATRIAGQGPTLMTEYSPFGARHFLRAAAAESASDLRTRPDLLRSGRALPKGGAADIDRFELSAVLPYRTLVLRRSPLAGRPPSPYRLILRDRYWEVWQRPARPRAPVLAQISPGGVVEPAATPSCAAVRALAGTPGAVRLLAMPAARPLLIGAGEGAHPRRWSDGAERLALAGAGSAKVMVAVPQAGEWEVWLGGSIAGPVTVAINGVRIGVVGYEAQEGPAYAPVGRARLQRGIYTISIRYPGGGWRPGRDGPPAIAGPLVLARRQPEAQPFAVAPADARALCGRTLDWVEAIGR